MAEHRGCRRFVGNIRLWFIRQLLICILFGYSARTFFIRFLADYIVHPCGDPSICVPGHAAQGVVDQIHRCRFVAEKVVCHVVSGQLPTGLDVGASVGTPELFSGVPLKGPHVFVVLRLLVDRAWGNCSKERFRFWLRFVKRGNLVRFRRSISSYFEWCSRLTCVGILRDIWRFL